MEVGKLGSMLRRTRRKDNAVPWPMFRRGKRRWIGGDMHAKCRSVRVSEPSGLETVNGAMIDSMLQSQGRGIEVMAVVASLWSENAEDGKLG